MGYSPTLHIIICIAAIQIRATVIYSPHAFGKSPPACAETIEWVSMDLARTQQNGGGIFAFHCNHIKLNSPKKSVCGGGGGEECS